MGSSDEMELSVLSSDSSTFSLSPSLSPPPSSSSSSEENLLRDVTVRRTPVSLVAKGIPVSVDKVGAPRTSSPVPVTLLSAAAKRRKVLHTENDAAVPSSVSGSSAPRRLAANAAAPSLSSPDETVASKKARATSLYASLPSAKRLAFTMARKRAQGVIFPSEAAKVDTIRHMAGLLQGEAEEQLRQRKARIDYDVGLVPARDAELPFGYSSRARTRIPKTFAAATRLRHQDATVPLSGAHLVHGRTARSPAVVPQTAISVPSSSDASVAAEGSSPEPRSPGLSPLTPPVQVNSLENAYLDRSTSLPVNNDS